MSRSTKIGCITVFVLAICAIFATISIERVRGRAEANKSALNIYALASASDYASLKNITTDSALLTLQKADQEHGRITAYKIVRTSTDISGRPSLVSVQVTRNGLDYVDDVAMVDNRRAAVIIEYREADWQAGREDRALRVIAK